MKNPQYANMAGYDENGYPITRAINQEVNVAAYQEGDSFSIGPAAGEVATWDISFADEFDLDLSWDTGTDAVTVFTSKDGKNWSPVERKPFDNNTRAAAASASLTANCDVTFAINAKKVKIVKAGVASTVTGTWSAKKTGRSK